MILKNKLKCTSLCSRKIVKYNIKEIRWKNVDMLAIEMRQNWKIWKIMLMKWWIIKLLQHHKKVCTYSYLSNRRVYQLSMQGDIFEKKRGWILMGFLITPLHKNSQNDVKLLKNWWFWHILGKGTHIYSNQNVFSVEGGKKLKNS